MLNRMLPWVSYFMWDISGGRMIIRKTQFIQYSGGKAMAWMISEMGFSP
jgi:hypothetical protein